MAHQSHRHHHSASEPGEPHMAALLDLDAEVLHAHLSEAAAWLADLTGDVPVRRILDLGCGTGAGTFTLLRRFEEAEALAVDASPQLLHHLRDRARDLGVADRVRTVEADLDAAWPALDGMDVVWASASLHHLADPDRALREVFTALRPGGLLAVAELDGLPRFLPDDLGIGRPGLEARCRATLTHRQAGTLPHLGADWGPHLSRAGFAIEAERPVTIALEPPLPRSAGRYAQTVLSSMRAGLDGLLSTDDLSVLDLLIDDDGPESVLRRGDLTVRTERTVWLARRPAVAG
ncbi:class I SAM-dependent methyltransferase [Streptomyces celluloflavus]